MCQSSNLCHNVTMTSQDNLVGIANQVHLLRRLEKFEAANITLESVMAATVSVPRHRERQKIGRLCPQAIYFSWSIHISIYVSVLLH